MATPSSALISKLRRLINEPTDTTYDDDTLSRYLEQYPLLDERGVEPYTWNISTTPPTQEDNDDWIGNWDINNAAADLWGEKASAIACAIDFSADGANFSRSQAYQHYTERERYFRARRSMNNSRLFKWPKNDIYPARPDSYIINLPEPD